LNGSDLTIRRLGRPGDLGWVVMAHGEIYAAEFGWDMSFEALVARIVAGYAAAHDPRLIAVPNGGPGHQAKGPGGREWPRRAWPGFWLYPASSR